MPVGICGRFGQDLWAKVDKWRSIKCEVLTVKLSDAKIASMCGAAELPLKRSTSVVKKVLKSIV